MIYNDCNIYYDDTLRFLIIRDKILLTFDKQLILHGINMAETARKYYIVPSRNNSAVVCTDKLFTYVPEEIKLRKWVDRRKKACIALLCQLSMSVKVFLATPISFFKGLVALYLEMKLYMIFFSLTEIVDVS